MRKNWRQWVWRATVVGLHGSLLELGCTRNFYREIEVLFATEANLNLVRDSVLVNWLGPQILNWW